MESLQSYSFSENSTHGQLTTYTNPITYCRALINIFGKASNLQKYKDCLYFSSSVDQLEKIYSTFLEITSQCDDIINEDMAHKKFKIVSIENSEELSILVLKVECLFSKYAQEKAALIQDFNNLWAQALPEFVPEINRTLLHLFRAASAKIKLLRIKDKNDTKSSKVIRNLNTIDDHLCDIKKWLFEVQHRLELAYQGILIYGLDLNFDSINRLKEDLQGLSQTCEIMKNSASIYKHKGSSDCKNIFPLPQGLFIKNSLHPKSFPKPIPRANRYFFI